MPRPVLSENLIVINANGDNTTAEDVITLLCQRLAEDGYVDSCYAQAVLDRENRFPTALPTLPYPTAIPHADAQYVKETGVAVAILDQPVPFRAMESPDQQLDVRAVLLLAVAHSSEQVTMLQWVCDILNRQDLVEQLVAARSPAAALGILKQLIERSQQGVCEDV
jgi:PTS system galactitol-specific IIA component